MRTRQRSRRGGFTLLEIMVALAVGGIAISSLYAVGSASTRHFREQQRISSAQTALRSAMDQLKHDIQRAGFLATPSSTAPGEVCSAVPSGVFDSANLRLAGISRWTQNATAPSRLDPAGLNTPSSGTPFYTVDQLWTMGNYSTSGEYPGISIGADLVTISVPMNWQSFQRDFLGWGGATAGSCDAAAFSAAFPAGRMVRLHSLTDTNFFSRVSRVTCVGAPPAMATVVLTDAVPVSCNMNGGWIAPVSTLRYIVDNATNAEDARDQRMTVLRRTEVTPTARDTALQVSSGTGTVPVEDRALLDYVVRFSVNFIARTNTGPQVSFPPVTQADSWANPERIRGAIIDIAVRTSQQEVDFTSSVPTAAFRLSTGRGAARVRRAHAELLIHNLASRGL